MEDVYEGDEEITSDDQIIRYLADNYVITVDAATEVLKDPGNRRRIDTAKLDTSFVYYAGDEIAEAECLKMR